MKTSAFLINDDKVVIKFFMMNNFKRFRTPREIISDEVHTFNINF